MSRLFATVLCESCLHRPPARACQAWISRNGTAFPFPRLVFPPKESRNGTIESSPSGVPGPPEVLLERPGCPSARIW